LSGQSRITPLPFRNEPPFGETALKILHLSQEAWVNYPTLQVQSTHLLSGLLELGGITKKFFNLLASETGNSKLAAGPLKELIEKGLKQKSVSVTRASVQETDGYKATVMQAKQETRRYGALMVEELHLLLSLLRNPGASITKVLRLCGATPKECMSYLELMYPPENKSTVSEFPSEII
jgi:ATP-dependent Clp protease ATP-binding subunit ClpA